MPRGRISFLFVCLGLLGAGCGIPEPIYVEHVPPAVTYSWPEFSPVLMGRAGGQIFTLCAHDEEGGILDYYWTVRGMKREGGPYSCPSDMGMTFSVSGSLFTLGTSVPIAAVAADSRGKFSSRVWTVIFQ